MPQVESNERTEQWCRLLLRRYGVMFRDLLANESAAPSWQELVRTYRRMEARGEIRGGRFVANVSGEQYALTEVIAMLRSAATDTDEPAILSATDPLNLSSRIGTTSRVPALPGYTIEIVRGQVREFDLEKKLEETERSNLG
jgi:ATP-dependent Lhr-like helicase